MRPEYVVDMMEISGKEVWPIIEGGKGVAISTGATAGAFAAANAVGTFSIIQADLVDDNGKYVPPQYLGRTRNERHEELVEYSIKAGISQAKVAHNKSGGKGRIHINMLWEAGGAARIMHGVLAGAKGLIHGVTCGAGMPYGLAEIAAKYDVYYYPIVSSAKAFNILWQRAYHKYRELLGGVVYEDPWLAGGHNGLSNREDPLVPEAPYSRIASIRKLMDSIGCSSVPIVIAGGVWHLREWKEFINSRDIGKVAFQFGTRSLLTAESPLPQSWKKRLINLRKGDITLNHYSPTGFYSSAINNSFLKQLEHRSQRQVWYSDSPTDDKPTNLSIGLMGRSVFVSQEDLIRANEWMAQGYSRVMKTPSSSIIFVTPEEWSSIREDQISCKGCLSHCRFSNWMDQEPHTTGNLPDPRSFCIIKTLTASIHTEDSENNLLFSGHNGYRFATDPLYVDGNVPTIQQLVDKILIGE